MNASDLRALRQIAISIASGCSAMIEILEAAQPAGEAPASGDGVARESPPEKMLQFFGRKPADESPPPAPRAVDVPASGAIVTTATD